MSRRTRTDREIRSRDAYRRDGGSRLESAIIVEDFVGGESPRRIRRLAYTSVGIVTDVINDFNLKPIDDSNWLTGLLAVRLVEALPVRRPGFVESMCSLVMVLPDIRLDLPAVSQAELLAGFYK